MFTLTTCTNPQQSPAGCTTHLKHLNHRGCSLLLQHAMKNSSTASLSFSLFLLSSKQTAMPLVRPVVSTWCREHLKEQAPCSSLDNCWFSVPWVSPCLLYHKLPWPFIPQCCRFPPSSIHSTATLCAPPTAGKKAEMIKQLKSLPYIH